MKTTLLISLIAVIAAFNATAQQNPVAAKPAETKTASAQQSAPSLPSTAKIWRLVSKTQALRAQLEASDAGKAVKDAESELQAEQSRLAALCGQGFVLGYDNDSKSPSYQDIICQKAPVEQAKIDPPKGK